MPSRIREYLIKPGVCCCFVVVIVVVIVVVVVMFVLVCVGEWFPTDVSFVEVSCVGSGYG